MGNGSVLVDPIQASYAPGTVVTLTAVISLEATFLGWSGDLSGNTTPETIVMNANKSVIANFTGAIQTTFTLTVSLTGDGSGLTSVYPPNLYLYLRRRHVSLSISTGLQICYAICVPRLLTNQ